MRRSLFSAFLLAACLFVATPGPGYAADEGAAGPPTRLNIISTNPILDMFAWLNIEYERVITKSGTIGAAGSYLTLDDGDESYTSGNLFYRYYPAGIAPEGFFFGGRFGMTSVSKDKEGDSADASAFGFGIDIGYTWLIGAPKRMALSLGIGAVRYFGGDLEDIDASMTLPTIRLVNVGIAF
jgi:hypothetical protein